ncbi:hypothetical protein JXA47_17490 [Candidatus Sumerlaeota bacterium]|nr:hypothetical protein [Candidatus Sumerlaeota bacterium]
MMLRPWTFTLALMLGFASALAAQSVPEPTDLATLDLTVRHRVRTVYFAPSDRPFPPGIRERLDTWIRLTRQFYRDEMDYWGYRNEDGRGKTFVIDQAPDGMWDVVFMVGEHDAAHYQSFENPGDPWAVGGECLGEILSRLPAVFHNDNVTLYFFDTFEVEGESIRYTCNGGSGAPWEGEGAGYVLQGTHFLGAGFQTVALRPADQAEIFMQTESSGIREIRWDSQTLLLTRGEFASTYFGVPVHEIGHAFYLDHVFTDTDGDGVENNVMGNGFRRFGGRFGMPGPDEHPTILSPENAAELDTAIMFNQEDPFDISAVGSHYLWR